LALLVPLLITHELGEQGRLGRDGALAFQFVIGLFVAGYAACASLRREIQTGVLPTILSKVVSRETFFLGKWAGVAAVILLFSLCAGLAALLSQRVAPQNFEADWRAVGISVAAPVAALAAAAATNYVTGRPYAVHALLYLAGALLLAVLILAGIDRAGHLTRYGAALDWCVVPVSLLIAAALLILATLALVLALRWNTAPVIVALAVVFALGLTAGHLSRSFPPAGGALRWLIPDWQQFWQADALSGGGVPGGYVARALASAMLYICSLLCAGMALCRHSEIK
jgi:ABC-type Na+ efflux pump permease subunit